MNKLFTLLALLTLAVDIQCGARVEILENFKDRENDFRYAEPLCPGGSIFRSLDGTLKCCRDGNKNRHCSLLVCDQLDEPGYEIPISDNKVRGLQVVCPHGEAYRHRGQMFCCHGHNMHRMCTNFACIENYGTLLEDFSYDEYSDDRSRTTPLYKYDRPDFCYLPPEEGGVRCRAYFERYYFNKDTGRCQKFIYGGCRGTKNNFVTLDECVSTCER